LFDIPLSSGAMYGIWREHGSAKRKKRYQRQGDLREVKRELKVFEVIQIETKRLDDIEELYPAYRRYKLPRYQFTARDVRTGGVWMAYAMENTLTNAVWFLRLLALHLRLWGVDLKQGWQKKESSEFVRLVERDWGGHFPIPPGAKTYNSDVEALHGRIEQEFYRIEPIGCKAEFFGKAKVYLRWFNYHRMNHYKEAIPFQLLSDLTCNQYHPQIFDLDPVLLDSYIPRSPGYNLPANYSKMEFFP
jgi:hypothetical protein